MIGPKARIYGKNPVPLTGDAHMKLSRRLIALASFVIIISCQAGAACAAGQYVKVDYPASTEPGELQIAVTYTLWIPDGAASLSISTAREPRRRLRALLPLMTCTGRRWRRSGTAPCSAPATMCSV